METIISNLAKANDLRSKWEKAQQAADFAHQDEADARADRQPYARKSAAALRLQKIANDLHRKMEDALAKVN